MRAVRDYWDGVLTSEADAVDASAAVSPAPGAAAAVAATMTPAVLRSGSIDDAEGDEEV
jgi:hypothetical protein